MAACTHLHFEENRELCVLINPCVGRSQLIGLSPEASESLNNLLSYPRDSPIFHDLVLTVFTSTHRNRSLASGVTTLDEGVKCKFHGQVNLGERVWVSAYISTGPGDCDIRISTALC